MWYSLKIARLGSCVSNWDRVSDFSSSWQNHGTRASLVWIGSLFGLYFHLFLEDVLGQFGGKQRLYFHAQLEHMVFTGQLERRWVAFVFRISGTEKLLYEETNAMCYWEAFKNQSCSSRNSNRIICKALWCPSGSCKVKYFQQCLAFAIC